MNRKACVKGAAVGAFCLAQYMDYWTTKKGIEEDLLSEGNPLANRALDKFGFKGLAGLKIVTSIPALATREPLLLGGLACFFGGVAANNYRLLREARKESSDSY